MSGVITTGEIQGLRTLKDKSIRLTFDTQEMTPEQLTRVISMQNAFAKMYISTDNITQDEKDVIDNEQMDNQSKSPSQRLRNVLFRYWEQDHKGYDDFNLYYNFMMSQIIEAYKIKLI